VRVFRSIFKFFNFHKFLRGISSCLIFSFFTFSSLIAFGQNSSGIGVRPQIVVLDLSSGSNGTSYPVTYLGSLPNDWNSTVYKTNKVILKWVDPGVFDMGQTGVTNADIVRQITLTRGFYMGIYEITGSQYEKVVGFDPSVHGGGTKAVDRGTWNEVRGGIWPSGVPSNSSFIGKVRQKTNGDIFDLPTEAQWEFVARAGTSTTYFFGNQNSEMSNYAWDNTSTGSTFEVGLKLPNPWGFFDVYGNAREYCLDYAGSYQLGPQVDPVGLSSSNSGRTIRGSGILSTAARSYVQPDDDSGLRGFRILLNTLNVFPNNLGSVAPLTILENQPIGTVVGEFNATDLDANASLTYHLVSGAGDGNNSLFTLDQNGTLNTVTVFDFETNASTYSIRVQARDEFNATTEGNFTVNLTDIFEDLDGDGLSDHLEQVGSTQIRIRAQIDGKSRLVFKKGSIQWNHVFYAKPGQHNGANYPTTINGDLDWMPQWTNDISNEFNQTNVDLRGTVQVQPIVARNSLSIVQQPNISNGQTTIVEIFDTASGSSFYEFILTGEGLSGYLTDPQDPDSDNDGFNDGMEVTSGSNPLIISSTPLNHGLVAWYPFDGNASDMSGNGNHGTVNGATLSADRHGHANKAYSFDGVDDQIIVANHSSVNFGQGDFSLISWIKYTGSDRGALFYKYNGNTYNNLGFVFYLVPEIRSARLFLSDGVSRYDDTLLPFNLPSSIWHQIGLSINFGSSAVLFVDGVSQGILQISDTVGSIDNTNPLLIGSNDINSEFFNGSIDDIRIYNRALSSEEVRSLYRVESPNHFVEMNSTVDLEMIWAEPGTFTMGSPTSESGRNSDENSHNVTLSKGFYLGKYEVTQAQYEAVMTGVTGDLNATPSNWSGNPNRPVDSVSYEDIQVFLVRLNVLESNKTQNGWAYVLPTEAQWEYACRAGTSTRYSWGNSISATDANWDHGADPDRPVDVGSFSPNAFGFHDMHGNVYEWVADWYGVYSNTSLTDPLGLQNGSQKVIRGGAYGNGVVANLRAAFRYKNSTSLRANGLGFRLAYLQVTHPPSNLSSNAPLTISENQPIGTVVGEFNATDPDANATLTYQLVSGAGDGNNSLYTLDQNGTLKTAVTFDYETNASSYSIRVQASDEFNATIEGNFMVTLLDDSSEDLDGDGFTDTQEISAGTEINDANSTPGLNFGLVAWYPFDGNASDISGNGNHGTVNGASLDTDRHGMTGQAYSFDGVNDFIEVQNSNELKFLDQYSILVWVKAPNFQRRYNHIITKMAGSISSFEIYGGYQSGGTGLTLVHNRSLASNHMQYSSSLPDNAWHHFGLTYANGILKRFDDGVSSASYTGWPKVEPQESSLYIGRGTISTSAGTEFMQGYIDDVRIYNRALSTSEVAALYQLENTPPDLNATVTGTVQYNGMIPGPAYVWALDANGTKVEEQILADGNGSYSLSVPKGAGYDFKVFIDGTGDGNPQAYEVWKHIGDWNSSLGGFNLTHVDGNLSGINFNLFDSDYDSDGFTNWQEYQAGTNQNDANSTPGLNFGLVAWYPFDGNASDMSGNGNHGTVNGATLDTDRHGQTGMAYDFDGVNDKIIVNGSWPSGNSSRSVSVWYKAPSHKGNIFTFGDGLLQKARFSVGLNFNNIHGSLGFIGQGSDQMFSVNGLYDSWNMILITYNGLLGNLYFNGNILSESFNYILETNGSMPLVIGSNSLNRDDEFFSGCIDDVRIYNRALSSSEVFALYQFEKPIYFSTSSPLSILENKHLGSEVGYFSLLNQDSNSSILFELVDGNGSDANYEFSLDQNGTLRTAVVFDYEGENSDNDPTLHVRVRARDEYNASVEKSFIVTILDVNESTVQIPTDQNQSVEHNSTSPIFNQPIDGITTGVDHNNTGIESNVSSTVVQNYRPIPQTLNFIADQKDSYRLFGRLLADGGSSILESGFLISTDILFGPKTRRIPAFLLGDSGEISVLVEDLKAGSTYYYRVYAKNSVGETVGAVKRLKTSEKIDPNAWFTDMPKMGGGWRSSNWFGPFQQFPQVKWIYHSELGWAYILSDQKDGIWIWQNGRGWMWTQQGVWPYLFNHTTLGWLYLVKSINGNPFFYDYTIGNYSAAP